MSDKLKVVENHLHDTESKWFAVYTNFKREKLAVKELKRKAIECYVPLQKVVRKYQRKTKTVELPLITCYIFVKITRAEYVKVLETEYVLSFVKFSKNLLSIPENEINLLKRILGDTIEVEVERLTLYEGDEVEIMQGSLTGLKGKLVSFEGREKVVIDLENLGYSLRLSLDSKLVHKINKQSAY